MRWVAATVVLVLLAAAAAGAQELTPSELRKLRRLTPLPPPPPDPTNRVADDPRAARLGQWLFFDVRLSANGAVSCATCHDPARGFTDGKPVAETLGKGTRRTPSLWNVAYQRWFFWDGRADSLWSQALEPIENPLEMGSSRLAALHLVHGDAELRAAYEALFGALPELEQPTRFPSDARPVPDHGEHPHHVAWTSMTAADRDAADRAYANLGKAIAAYERRLVRGDAPFDRFAARVLAGEEPGPDDISPAARRGLALFLGRGSCTTCHNGPAFSDSEFHNTGVPPPAGGAPDDPGRYGGIARLRASPFHAGGAFSDAPDGAAARRVASLRGGSETWGEFKTPSLRNLADRAPFFHAGQLGSLAEVIGFYSTLEGAAGRSHHQERILEPLDLDPGEARDLEAFLATLEGAPPDPALLAAPVSPGLD